MHRIVQSSLVAEAKVMKIKRLGSTGLRVSELCLGAMTFGMSGWGCDEPESLAIIDRYFEAGGNFLDTADVYSGGLSEELCGRGVRGRRSGFVVATKCTIATGPGANDRGASRKHILEACETSLRRLNTDYIDLFQVHVEDIETPLEETLSALDALVRSGKVLYTGCSNYRAFRLAKALALADRHDWARFASLQAQYNLLVRGIEREHIALCQEEGVGLITWSPLAAGMLTGKYQRDGQPKGARLAEHRIDQFHAAYFSDTSFDVVDVVKRTARELGCTPAQLALAWQLHKPAITSVCVGVRNTEQLADVIGATALWLDPEIVARLDDANPLPREYPYDLIDTLQGWLATSE